MTISTVEAPEALPVPVARETFALNWPSPHYMLVIDPGADSQPEDGLVTLNDGAKLPGTVLRIDFDAGTLEFRPEAGPRRVLPFSFFRSLCLARAIELERIPLAVPPGSVEALPSKDKRKCVINFKGGSTLEADIVSAVPRKAGLFLFVPNDAGGILRWFVPAQAIGNYRIGEPLGQALRGRKALESEALDAGLLTQQRLQNTKIGDYLAQQGGRTRE